VQVVVTRRPPTPRHRRTGLSVLLVLLVLIVAALVAVILATRPVASHGAGLGQCAVVSAPVSGCDLALTRSIVAGGARQGPA
jgi:hypothetical protein